MSMLTKNIVLSLQQTFDSTHQSTTLTCQVRGSLTLEGCLEQIARADTDTHSQCLLLSLARSILINSVRAVQTATLKEHSTKRCTRTLRSNHDHIDVLWRNNTRTILPVDGETMGIVQCLTSSKMFLDCWPNCNLTSVRKQHTDNCTLLYGLFNREQCLTRHPTVGLSLLVAAALTLTNDDIEAIIAKVTCLTRTLNTITNDGDRLILQHLTCLIQCELFACHDVLNDAAKIHLCHN